ncbi:MULTISPECIES: SRPBCC family protein [Oscillatoriales]|nr:MULTISPECIES: SRPBCC family protein [Oscillatoriales]
MPDSLSNSNPMLQRSVEEVDCSVQQVYDLWANLENVPRWMPLVKSVKRLKSNDELWHWTFGLGFPLLTEYVTFPLKRVPLPHSF